MSKRKHESGNSPEERPEKKANTEGEKLSPPPEKIVEESRKRSQLTGFPMGGSMGLESSVKELDLEGKQTMEHVYEHQRTGPGKGWVVTAQTDEKTAESLFVLEDFTSERQKQNFPDLFIKTYDGKIVYFHRFLIVRSRLEVLKVALATDVQSPSSTINLDFPAWAVSVALNVLIGKELTNWGFVIAAAQVLHQYGDDESVAKLIAQIERQHLPWPIVALEKLYGLCKLNIRQLANAWMQAVPPNGEKITNGGLLGGGDLNDEFWASCETAVNPRFDNAIFMLIPKWPVSPAYQNALAKHVIQCPYFKKKTCLETLQRVVDDELYRDPDIACITAILSTWAVSAKYDREHYEGRESFTSLFRD